MLSIFYLVAIFFGFVKLNIILDLRGTSIHVEARLIQLIQKGIGEIHLRPFSFSLTAQHLCIGIHRRTPPSLSCAKASSLCTWFGTPSLQPLKTTFHPSLWNTKLYFMKHIENSTQAQNEPQVFLIHVRTCSTREGTHHWKHSKSNTVQSHKGISLDHMFLPATRVRKGLYFRSGQHLSLQAPSLSHQPTMSYRERIETRTVLVSVQVTEARASLESG
jgi:hypothetical protein